MIIAGVVIIFFYSCVIVGSCSPIHMRIVVAASGIGCIILAYIGGYGICGLAGWYTSGIHNLLPFIIICIGVDDMFVVCNALDQTDFSKTVEERFKIAFYNCGPNITVTTLTNVVSFSISMLSTAIALRSFCFYATICIAMCYCTIITTFSCILVWDTERVHKKKPDCCRIFCCAEDSWIFCKGKLLSRQ